MTDGEEDDAMFFQIVTDPVTVVVLGIVFLLVSCSGGGK